MTGYVGVRCPVCAKKFSPSDDIVVCPTCGAPHHRECYSLKGECAFSDDHMSGKEWKPPQSEVRRETPESETISCERCGSSNPAGAIFCQICGANIGRETRAQDLGQGAGSPFQRIYENPFGGVKGDETIADVPVVDIACYVGPGASYYLPRFYAFDKHGRQIMPSVWAFLFTFFYCFYRKMYTVGAVLLGVYLVSLVPFFLLAGELGMDAMTAWILGDATRIFTARETFYINVFNYINVAGTALRIGLALFANHLYFNHAVKQVREISLRRGEFRAAGDYRRALASAGGVNQLGVFALGGSLFFVSSAILAFIWMNAA